MAYWDTSALVKLYVQEADSAVFRQLAGTVGRIVTGAIASFEARTVFCRREAEGMLSAGEAGRLAKEFSEDAAADNLTVQEANGDVEKEFGLLLEKCFSHSPPMFVRTNDAIHLASAKVAGEVEFVTADLRQRAAAELLGLTVLP